MSPRNKSRISSCWLVIEASQEQRSGPEGVSTLDYLVLQGYEHGWYGGSPGPFSIPDAPDVSNMIWSFFARHPRREKGRTARASATDRLRLMAS